MSDIGITERNILLHTGEVCIKHCYLRKIAESSTSSTINVTLYFALVSEKSPQ